ncbi:GNAT family N-acetyltransferase [Microbacterium sp. SS28]|uniref:GNAT family N-acetyltransferase n=1 Tax=Microbacterium sp. SS28 TaxID=2919948 RepID=UPI001FAA2D75|nr:GNAT family N-acetyltransferase [Microbacterium sp. SS28]
MSITYVERGPVDDVALSRLHDLAFGGILSGDVAPWSARLRAHSVGWVCAYDGDRLCGFVHACWDGGSHAFVLDTAVLPDLQGRGIGSELLRRLTALAREAGCEWLHVDYEPHLDGFYTAAGFTPTLAGLHRLG